MANDPIKMRIYKKIGTGTGVNNYVLYYPETTADQVLYSYTSLSNVANVKAALDKIFSEIDAIEGVLEFKDNSTVANLPTDGNKKGEVYVVQYPVGEEDAHIWWSADGTTWEEYPSNTLFVCSADENKNYINTTNSTSQAKAGWIPLGGTNSAYATKNEAISTLSVSGTGITGAYASGTTFSLGGAMAITPVSTMGITQTISVSSTTNQIPSAKAVYDFAGAAGTLNIALATTGYIAGTTSIPTGSAAPLEAVGSGIQWSYVDAAGTTPAYYIIDAHVPFAADAEYATYAGQVSRTFGIGGWNDATTPTWKGVDYDGSTEHYVNFGGGLRADLDSNNNNNLNVWIKTGDGLQITGTSASNQVVAAKVQNSDSGLTVSSAGLAVSVDTAQGIAINHESNKLFVKLDSTELVFDNNSHGIAHKTSGITAGVYSAVSVNSYGHATAGGQSVIFASNINDPDLGALVVGGLAFIGSSSVTGTNGASGTSITIDSN